MAYPTGSGSEILYRGTIHAQSTSGTAFRWYKTNPTTGTDTYTVPANHIITVLNINFCDANNSANTFYFYVHDGSQTIYFLHTYPLGALQTFSWNEKIVLVGGDKLTVSTANAGNMDVFYTFIDQDWT